MNKSDRIPLPVGASALLVIFTVLCLTIFAMLALATVKADARLSREGEQAIRQYYKADCEAESILARLREGQQVDNVTVDGDIYSYTCEVSDTQVLQVVVRITGRDYEILCWKEVSTIDWTPDDTLDLWDIEEEMTIID